MKREESNIGWKIAPVLKISFVLLVAIVMMMALFVLMYTNNLRADSLHAVDPTYEAATNFIRSDKTDENRYIERVYDCWHFALDFKKNALKAGYRCGFVLVYFAVNSHSINCFNTTDQDLLFVEPQSDQIVVLKVGQTYWDQIATSKPGYNDTILDILTIW